MKSRAASATPRKDEATGTWWFVVDGGTGPDGNRRQVKRRGFRTKKAAQEALDKVRREVTTKTYVAPAQQTLAEYLEKWLDGLTTRLRPSTVDGYRRCMKYVIPVLGGRRLDHVTPKDLDQLYAALLTSGLRQRTGGLSVRTVRYVHTVLQKALSDAVRKGDLARNVATMADHRGQRTRSHQRWRGGDPTSCGRSSL